MFHSANGAKYDSRGQARSASPLVRRNNLQRALKVRNIIASYSALSELHGYQCVPGATRLALLDAYPWLSYFAPLALVTTSSVEHCTVGAFSQPHHSSAICRRVTEAGGKRNAITPAEVATCSLRGCTAFGFS